MAYKPFVSLLAILCLMCPSMRAQNAEIARYSQASPVSFADISIDDLLLPGVLKRIAETYQVVIGLEYSLTPPYDRGLTIHLSHASLTDALNAVTKARPQYSWHRDSDSAFHVFTKDAPNLGDVTIGTLEVKQMNLQQTEGSLDSIPEVNRWLKDNGFTRAEVYLTTKIFSVDQPASAPKSPQDTQVSFSIRDKAFREVLDEIAKKYDLHFWTIGSYSHNRISIRFSDVNEY